jgi:hypothetical protein
MTPLLFLTATPDPTSDTQGFIRDVFQAVQGGNWRYVAALAVIALVAAARKYGPPILTQGRWAWAFAVALGAVGALGTALASSVPLGGVVGVLSILASGAFTGVGAAGIVKGAKEWTAKPPTP